MNLRPTGNRIVVERTEASDLSPGGIAIPDASKPKLSTGRVLAVGPGSRDGISQSRRWVELDEGDEIVFHPNAGVEHIRPGDKPVLIMNEGDVLAVVVPAVQRESDPA